MPSVLSRAAELERKFLKNAPKKNQPKIEKVLAMYKDKANMNFTVVQNMVLAPYSPSLFEKRRKLTRCARTPPANTRARMPSPLTTRGA